MPSDPGLQVQFTAQDFPSLAHQTSISVLLSSPRRSSGWRCDRALPGAADDRRVAAGDAGQVVGGRRGCAGRPRNRAFASVLDACAARTPEVAQERRDDGEARAQRLAIAALRSVLRQPGGGLQPIAGARAGGHERQGRLTICRQFASAWPQAPARRCRPTPAASARASARSIPCPLARARARRRPPTSGPNRRRRQRDWTVGGSVSGYAVIRMRMADGGGSSSVFSSASCACSASSRRPDR